MDKELVRELISCGCSYDEIAQELRSALGTVRGFSARSLRRFCQNNGLRRQPVSNEELDYLVTRNIVRYGHSYGRTMMQGSIRADLPLSARRAPSERRVSEALRRGAPEAFEARTRNVLDRTNPIPYYAPYFGYKLHIDQNEKLVMFGCTHVCLIDGCSRAIVGFCSMPIKNPIVIYENVLRPTIAQYGLWDQLR